MDSRLHPRSPRSHVFALALAPCLWVSIADGVPALYRSRDPRGAIPRVVRAAQRSLAFAAKASDAAIRHFVAGIVCVELVAVQAMRLARLKLRVTTLRDHVVDVVGVRAEEQVRGIHALPVVAAMQDAHAVEAFSFGNWSEAQLPRDAMRRDSDPVALEVAVAARIQAGRPFPAIAGLIDLRPEALRHRNAHGMKVTQLAGKSNAERLDHD